MDELYDDLVEAIYSLEDAAEALSHFSEEKSIVEELIFSLEEKRQQILRSIEKRDSKELAALTREYYDNL